MLGEKSKYAQECVKGSFIGVDFFADIDLADRLPDNWKDFNHNFIPIYLESHVGKSKIAAGLACGATWTVSKGITNGDIVLCPNGIGSYMVGEVIDGYAYQAGGVLPHRRPVRWFTGMIERKEMSLALKNSTGSIGTVSDCTKYADEIEVLIAGNRPGAIVSTDETIEDVSVFALEEHLEEFLVKNWQQTELGKHYDIYEQDNELVGQQFPTDTGYIDILAIGKNRKELLVIELKRGRASDVVVGQIQRYMGFVLEELAEKGQVVKGIIIALDDDLRIRRALSVANNIEFYRYQVSFKLFKN